MLDPSCTYKRTPTFFKAAISIGRTDLGSKAGKGFLSAFCFFRVDVTEPLVKPFKPNFFVGDL